MEFQAEQIATLGGSLQFLINAMSKTCQYITRDRLLENKPFWMVQTEKFSSFFNRIKDNLEAMENFRHKVVAPVYETHNVNMLNQLVSSDGVVQDDFLKVTLQQSNDFRIKVSPGGVYFQLDKLFLPISEVYTQAVNYSLSHKNENVPFPVFILLGFYSSIYQAVKDKEDNESMEMLKNNIDVLSDSMETCDQPPPKTTNSPVDMLQSMLGNIDMGQIGEMMGKVTGDPQASKEFGEVFSKMTDVIKNGGNPLDAMGDIIKNASMRVNEEPVSETVTQEQENTEETLAITEGAQEQE